MSHRRHLLRETEGARIVPAFGSIRALAEEGRD